MTNTIKELFNRKSVRVFTNQNISDEDKKIILESAIQAPSAGNQQMYTIIDVQDEKIKEELSILCDNQPFIAKAKMVLVFCADWRKWYDLFALNDCNPRPLGLGDLALAMSDTNIAAKNAVVAAESLGIGSCYIGDVMENYEKMKDCLNIPKNVFPCAMLVFGYPTTQQKNRQKPVRHNLSDMVCVDKYQTKDKDQLKEMFKNKSTNDFSSWVKAFCERKYNSDFSKEMSRSVEKYFEEFKKV